MDDTKNSTRETEGKKTTQDHWQRIWRRQTPYTYGFLRRTIKSPTDRRLGLVFKQHLPQERKRILEIGCASGRWLVRFKREFDYNVYGIDYSEAGCELAKETLRRTKIEGEIICGDIFDPSLQDKYKEFFDIVYSLGFIEHFSDPTDALDMHLRLLKPDGFLIVTVPNYGDGSINRKWIRITGREEHLVKTHNVELMKIATFKKQDRKSVV